MIPTQHPSSSHFDAELLHGYVQGILTAQERERVEQLLADSELSREAVAGYMAMPLALGDIAALKAEISARSGMSTTPAPSSVSWIKWVTISAMAAAAATAVVVSLPESEKPSQSVTEQVALNKSVLPENQTSPPAVVQEHFVNPQEKSGSIPKDIKLNAVTSNTTTSYNYDPSLLSNSSSANRSLSESDNISNTIQNSTLKNQTTQNTITPLMQPLEEAKRPEFKYNFPVIYVLDLKITDFNHYYEQTIEQHSIQLRGLPAEYEDNVSRQKQASDETIRKVAADKILREALLAFQDGRYGRCIDQFEILLTHSPDDVNAKFYIAVCYTKLELYNKAMPLLEQVMAASNNAFHQEAEWYKALILLNTGNTKEAKDLLQKILFAGGFYQYQAKEKLLQIQ